LDEQSTKFRRHHIPSKSRKPFI